MKDIANFCKTTISKLANKTREMEKELKHLLQKDTFEEIRETINTNQNIQDQTVRQQKQKKFQQLKFKPKQPQKIWYHRKSRHTNVIQNYQTRSHNYQPRKEVIAKQINKEKEVTKNLNEINQK